MVEIIPAITVTTLEEIEEKIRIVEGHADWVHIDIVDGKFASPETWPYNTIEGVLNAPALKEIKTSVNIELHLMTQTPEEDLDEWLDTQAKRILIHKEASADPHQSLMLLSMSKIEEGLVLNLDTPIEVLSEYYDDLEVIQLMGIKHADIGHQHAKFNESVLPKIKQAKNDYPDIKLSVDGGVHEDTIRKIVEAGADHLVVGSAIFGNDNPLLALKRLNNLVK